MILTGSLRANLTYGCETRRQTTHCTNSLLCSNCMRSPRKVTAISWIARLAFRAGPYQGGNASVSHWAVRSRAARQSSFWMSPLRRSTQNARRESSHASGSGYQR